MFTEKEIKQIIQRRNQIEHDQYPYRLLLPFISKWIELDWNSGPTRYKCNAIQNESKIIVEGKVCDMVEFLIEIIVSDDHVTLQRSGGGLGPVNVMYSRKNPWYVNEVIRGAGLLGECVLRNYIKKENTRRS